MRSVDRVVYVALALFGAFITFQGRQWELIKDKIPGPGFLPFWTGLLITLASLWPLALTFKDKSEMKPQPFKRDDIFYFSVIIGGGVFVAIFSQFIGMLISIGIMTAAVSWLMGMKRLPVVAAVSVGMPVSVYLIFVLLLDVPLPKSYFGV
jgi:hypothetical protein